MTETGTTGTDELPVAESNLDQLRAWDGDEGAHWARFADRYDAALEAYDEPFLAAAAVEPDDRALDVGCGNGRTTIDVARRARAGTALGVDLSAPMLQVSRARAAAAGLANASFLRADAQVHPFEPGGADLVVSRTGTMFFGDMPAAFANLARALRPGGRLVMLVWQEPARNEWFLELGAAFAAGRALPLPPPDQPGPFALADPDRARALLVGAGLDAPQVRALEAPMHAGPDVAEAERLWTGQLGWMLDGLDDRARTAALDAVRASLAAHEGDDGITYRSAAWLVTARRR